MAEQKPGLCVLYAASFTHKLCRNAPSFAEGLLDPSQEKGSVISPQN